MGNQSYNMKAFIVLFALIAAAYAEAEAEADPYLLYGGYAGYAGWGGWTGYAGILIGGKEVEKLKLFSHADPSVSPTKNNEGFRKEVEKRTKLLSLEELEVVETVAKEGWKVKAIKSVPKDVWAKVKEKLAPSDPKSGKTVNANEELSSDTCEPTPK